MKLLLALALATSMTASTTAAKVEIKDYAFQKPSITVVAGSTVMWTNSDDDPHTVVADDKSFDSMGLGQGDMWSHKFIKPGTYHYHCGVHPFMKGTIVVTAETKHI